MTETTVEFNRRCKAWGETDPGYRAIYNASEFQANWPAPPALGQDHMGAKWGAFAEDDYGPWYDSRVPSPPDDPIYSGGTGARRPPPAPPKRQ